MSRSESHTTAESDEPGAAKKSRTSHADLILKLFSQEETTVFCDELNEPHVRFRVSGHWEVWPCGSEEFKYWLTGLLYRGCGKAAGSESLAAAGNVIKARARFSSPKHALHNRVAKANGTYWYDMSDAPWRAVRVTSSGWEVVSQPPMLFHRYPQQQPQVEPARDRCDLAEVFRFINLRTESARRLLLAYLVACLVPDIPHPILLLCGPQGSAKTTAFRVLRRLVDPARPDVVHFPKSQTDLVQTLSDNWMPWFDNVGSLSGETSDMLCRAATGEGFSKHRLYTNTGVVLFDYRRCVGLNGVNIASYQPDLQDRCILLELEPVSPTSRKYETKFWADFEEMRPRLLAAMFDVLAKAIGIHDSIDPPELPRMADFARWGCAITEAMGGSQEEFQAAYGENASQRNQEILDNDLVARALEKLLAEEPRWEGSPSDLLAQLDLTAGGLSIDIKAKDWPKNPISLSKRLKTLSSNLAQGGIHIARDRSSGQREMTIRRNGSSGEPPIPVTRALNDRCDDGTIHPSSPEPYSHVGHDRCDGCDGSFSFSTGNKEREEGGENSRESFVTPVTLDMPQLTACALMESPVEANDGLYDGCDGLALPTGELAQTSAPNDALATPFPAPDSRAYYLRLGRLPLSVADWPPELRDKYEERAAIIEYEGGNTRACAEMWAALQLRQALEAEAARLKRGD